MVSAVKDQGQFDSCWAFSASQVVVSQWVPTSGGFRMDLSAQPVDFVPHIYSEQYVPRISWWLHLMCHRGGQCC